METNKVVETRSEPEAVAVTASVVTAGTLEVKPRLKTPRILKISQSGQPIWHMTYFCPAVQRAWPIGNCTAECKHTTAAEALNHYIDYLLAQVQREPNTLPAHFPCQGTHSGCEGHTTDSLYIKDLDERLVLCRSCASNGDLRRLIGELLA